MCVEGRWAGDTVFLIPVKVCKFINSTHFLADTVIHFLLHALAPYCEIVTDLKYVHPGCNNLTDKNHVIHQLVNI